MKYLIVRLYEKPNGNKRNGIDTPAILIADQYLFSGDGVIVRYPDKKIYEGYAVSNLTDPWDDLPKVADFYGLSVEELPIVIGKVSRAYWEEDENEK